MIKTIQDFSEVSSVEKLSDIVSKQMYFIGADNNPARINSAIKNALEKNKRAIFFVKINEDGNYCAFAFGNTCSGLESGADYFWINELYVEPEYRGKKIATEIMTYIEDWSKRNGIKYIATMTGESNEKAKGLYEKLGYDLSCPVWVDKVIK